MAAPTVHTPGFVDYYALLDTAPDADTATIRDRLDALILEWQQFTGSNKKNLRRRAEDMLELAARAEKTLLDPRRRAAYDTTHAQQARESTTAPSGYEQDVPGQPARGRTTPGTADAAEDPLTQISERLDCGDYFGARHLAARAVQRDPGRADAWFLLFRSCLRLKDVEGARRAGTRAVSLRPDELPWLLSVGYWLADIGDLDLAAPMVERAAELDTTPESGLLLASLNRLSGRPSSAVRNLRELRRRWPGALEVRDALAAALVEQAERCPEVQQGEHYLITSQEEVTRMHALLLEARGLQPQDREVRAACLNLAEAVTQAREPRLTSRLYRNEALSASVWGSGVVMPLLGLAMFSSSGGAGLLMVFAGVGALCLAFSRCRPYGWEDNHRHRDSPRFISGSHEPHADLH
ncbi:hypothetical protein GCM10007079_40450 [Nocardiopsis terrae]|uniref:Flp pilus assembly protein TadD n=1 Tax=Nocardiopsis terrae TaxID=372655 RepID=A0ABR9HEI4_9ACTN|nr:hypothetical protein [Nocardiopsis terrae]MBE1457432.1 Flp pilus assembly protein TadD [Nocardiopsis terrae]GHC92152.1 hypothetical protein GCM10007079_40450 [Nocardiopsis terrae]